MTKNLTSDYALLMERLKKMLKGSGITYAELSSRLSLSESGLKKILNARDGSFERVGEICKALNVSLADVLADLREGQAVQPVEFTAEQEAVFEKEPEVFRLYWKLVYERLSLSEVQIETGATVKEIFRTCRKLDDLGLLKVLSEKVSTKNPMSFRLVIPSTKAVQWTSKSAWVQKMYMKWAQDLTSGLIKKGDEKPTDQGVALKGALFILRFFKMTDETFQEFLRAQQNLETEFLRRCVREMKLRPKEVKPVRWLVGVDQKRFFE